MTIMDPAIRAGARAAGSDAPEKSELTIGFIPLTDCASVVMASVLGFDKKHGIRIVPSRQASWASVRDKLVGGELDAAHVLYGLVYGVHMGVGGPRKDMAVLMGLNRNGQAISLSTQLRARGAHDGETLKALVDRGEREFTLAHTFPTGTHAMWLYYWLASAGIVPMADVNVITVPPPQMLNHMRGGRIDGFSVGEPWNHRAVSDGVAVHAAASQQVWKDHPEKVLGASGEFVRLHPHSARAMVMAVLDASRWIDASEENRSRTAEVLARPEYLGTPAAAIVPRLVGRYHDGHGRSWFDPDHVRFFDGGAVNYPYLSDGMWFLTQFRRWGMLSEHPDYLDAARQINRIGLYAEAASALAIDIPRAPMRSSVLLDGQVWDGSDPAGYADHFAVRATRDAGARAARPGA